jgi:GNAT superfamily N-acetyltransferase
LIRVKNISKENLEDVFKICSSNRVFAPIDDPILKKAREVKKRWILDVLERYGPCSKIAYLDGRPVSQLLFYPEEAIPYINAPRKNVVKLQCIYNPFPEFQRKGVATALMKALVDECHTGLDCLGGKTCSFLMTLLFPHEGDLPLDEFYEKYGFKQGKGEMFLEIDGKYVQREIPEYHPLPEDRNKAVILYNPACEWGYFFAYKVKELLQGIDPVYPVEIFNIWERPEGYLKRPLKRIVSGHAIVNSQLISGGVFWTDREAFLRNVEKVM